MIDAYSTKIKINGSYLSMKCVSQILGISKATKKHLEEGFFCFVDLKDGSRIPCFGTYLGK